MENVFINPASADWNFILKRPAFETGLLEETVSTILEDVKLNGDDAVRKYAVQFDGVNLPELRVSISEMEEAVSLVSDELKSAVGIAKNNI